jgi:hypothetical protein
MTKKKTRGPNARARTVARPTAARTALMQARFLKEFAACGTVTRASRAAKVGRRTVYDWLERDAAFRELYEDALEEAVDMVEDEARRRAIKGTLKPVYQGGVQVGAIREYSDSLLLAILKGRRKDVFGDRHELTRKDGKALQTNVVLRYYPESMRPKDQVAELPPPSDEPIDA